MCDIDVAVVLLHEYVFANLVSVEEDIVEMEVHDEVHQLLLDTRWGGAILTLVARLAAKDADRVCCLPVRHGVCAVVYEGSKVEKWAAEARLRGDHAFSRLR